MLISCSDVNKLFINKIIALHDIDGDVKPLVISNKHKSMGKINVSLFNHNCRVIASGGEDSIINFHNSNLEYISCIEDPDFKGATITSLAFNNNSNYLAYATNLGHLKIWDLKTSSTQLNHKFFNNYITSMCFNQDSTFLTIGTVGGNIFNFNVLTFTISNFKYQSYFKLNYLKYSPLIPNLLAACFDDGFIRVFDMTSGEIINNFGGYHQGPVTGVCFSPINKVFLCSAGSDTRINFFDISAKKHIKTLTTDAPLTSICFNSDGQTIAVGNISGNIILYDLRICTAPKAIFKGHSSSINYIEFSKKPLNNLKLNSSNNLAASNNKANESLNNNSMRSNRSLASIDSNIPYNLQPNAVNTQKLTENKATSLSELKINAILNQAPPKINNDSNKNNIEIKDMKETKEVKEKNDNAIKLGNNLSHQSSLANIQMNQNSTILMNNNFVQPNIVNASRVPNKTTFTAEIDTNSISFEKKRADSLSNINIANQCLKNQSITEDYNFKKKLNLKNIDVSMANVENEDYNNLDNKTQVLVKKCMEAEMFKMKQFIHDEINCLHVDLVRQFEIQHNELVRSMKNITIVNNKMAKDLEKLKKENSNLKSKFF